MVLSEYSYLSVAAVALASLIWTITWNRKRASEDQKWNRKKAREDQEKLAIISNLNKRIDIQLAIGNNPDLLRFHGITDEELSNAGVSPEELAYLVASFTAGEIWYRINEKEIEVFRENSFRRRMLKSEQTRRAWGTVKKMMNDSEYVNVCDRTIADIVKPQFQ